MGLVRIALRNPYAVIVMVLMILVLGVTCISRIPTDLLPTFKTPAVQVLTLYPGMPAEVMERDITTRLERWTGQANGIARQESKSMIGVSVLRDYFRPDIDPNTAMSQVSSLAISDLYYLPPGTIPPMVMPYDPTASIPLALITVSSPRFDETKLYDVAYFDLRNRLQGITGVIAPAVYGGRIRRILAYVDREKLQARNLAPLDVVNTIRSFNTLIPLGNAKIGDLDYQINANGMVPTVEEMNRFPIRVDRDGGSPVYIKDVGHVEDSHQIQTNVVRINGKRQVYIPIYRQPGANTIQVVEGMKEALANILARLPQGINLDVVMDQSVYVRQAIRNLLHEGVLGALLAAVMILVFIGNFRSTLIIVLSIPLSVLAAFIGLYFTGDSVNAMTLGGLALAVGRLVDDAIVVLENTDRHLEMGKPSFQAALEAAQEVAMPVFAATVTTVVVFFPVVFLSGIGKYLFTPLALSVAFSIGASYLISMTVVPACCARFLGKTDNSATPSGGQRVSRNRLLHFFASGFAALQQGYRVCLLWALEHGKSVLLAAGAVFIASLFLAPRIGTELFPPVDAGQFTVLVRGPSGTRVEKTEELIGKIEERIRATVPQDDLAMMISNLGVLYDWPAAYTPNAGPQDVFVLVQLSPQRRRSAQEYAAILRQDLTQRFPGTEFAFDTGGLITAALNFGLPSPIDIQVEGNQLEVAHEIARQVKALAETVPGAVDVRIQQKLDYPQLNVQIDRIKAASVGVTAEDIVKNVVTATNSSVSFLPAFWIDEKNGNHYFVGAQYTEADINSLKTLEDIPITGADHDGRAPVLLKNIATFSRATAPAEVHHHNVTRVTNVYVNVGGRDVGSVAAEIGAGLRALPIPSGYFVHMRGEIQSMRESFQSLGFGFVLAVILVYLVMVAQFHSFLDPFIVLFAVPLGIIGVLWMLFLTSTSLNVQSFLGVIFMVGIAVSNSILLVEFANRARDQRMGTREAALEAGIVRLRPILMTSLAAVLGLLPMAIGLGHGSEANVPLARAVIGGLTVSTVLTLFVVPILYLMFKREQELVSAGSSGEQ